MALSNLTAPAEIAEKSGATPGLFNSRFSSGWQNDQQLNSDISNLLTAPSLATLLSQGSVFYVYPGMTGAQILVSASSATKVQGTLRFAAGVHTPESILTIDGPVLIEGEGLAWLTHASGATISSPLIRVNSAPSTASLSDVRIRNLGFDGSNVNRVWGVYALHTNRFSVEDCRFRNFGTDSFANPNYCIYTSGSTTSTVVSPFPWASFRSTPTGWATGTRILNNSFSSCSGAESIFIYRTDGAQVQANFSQRASKGVFALGANRNIAIVGNTVEEATDNGIRAHADDSAAGSDPRDCIGVTIVGNTVRYCVRDGIRYGGYQGTVSGNVSSHNTLSGIAAVVMLDSTIANNVCTDNLNHGIGLARTTVSGWGTYRNILISGNQTHRNAGRGIIVQGGGDSSASVAQYVVVDHNFASFNSLQGVTMWDCDETCEATHNIVHSSGSVGDTSGIGYTNQVMGTGTGGLLFAWNRCFDSRATPTAMQTRGMDISSVTAGSTVTGCRYYYNDLSGTTSNITTNATGIRTNLGNGTNTGSFLVGNVYRRVAIPATLTSSCSEIRLDETGFVNLTRTGARLSVRTMAASSITASAANSNVTTNEIVFTVGGASGASLAVHSGGTVYIFNSAISAKAT